MKGLLRLLRDHESSLTADFQRAYGLRLSDAVLSRSVDEMEDLILWLPKESAFRSSYTSKSRDQAARRWGWTEEKELLLSVINLLVNQTHVIAQSNSTKKIKAPEPIGSPLEGQKPNSARPDADNMARSLLAAAKARRKGL